ncbi:MAG: hypothetical protein ACRETM_05865 [Stenotrophobium sp.]
MRLPRSGIYALLLALLLGQELLVAHTFTHSLLSPPDQLCQLCAHAPTHSGSAVAPPPPLLVLAPQIPPPDIAPPALQLTATAKHYPIRGPPVSLV